MMPKQNPSLSVSCVFPTTSSMYLGMLLLSEQGPRPIPPAAGCLGRRRFKIPWEILRNLKPTRVRKSIIFTISIRQKKKKKQTPELRPKKNCSFVPPFWWYFSLPVSEEKKPLQGTRWRVAQVAQVAQGTRPPLWLDDFGWRFSKLHMKKQFVVGKIGKIGGKITQRNSSKHVVILQTSKHDT